ncbi:MAG: hypothetical protein HON53_00060 [Planctomycetaceae bacterium]|jgi:uracil-DNA glycosylase family 4|nr:hypothetical protein [Planctomycetaceae bacterium]MBT6154124.1 hypothetical protein [Planctomycetaceae bacterium]MBT6485803.1 hypothetical protein [Planctomycetaceae bacterium]
MSKQKYRKLVKERKACRECKELTNPSCVDDGCFDSIEIGPWTRWQGNLTAEVMVVGQDWGDIAYLRRHEGFDDESNRTNVTLMELLKSIKISVGTPNSDKHNEVFFTNAVLCLKKGGLQAKVNPEWFTNCSSFLRRQIEIVAPLVVVTLGNHALQAVRNAFNLPKKLRLAEAVTDKDGELLFGNTRLLATYHCGARVLNTWRPIDKQLKDWKRIGNVLKKTRGK